MRYLALCIATICCLTLDAQKTADSLETELQAIVEKEIVPGFASVIIRDGEVKFSGGYGYANVAEEIKYTDQTLQNIGSISKTFIGVALMKAQELGMLNLDDPISKYLDYEITNPKRPKEIITIRHLATHTAMLKDPDDYERAYIFEEKIEVGQNQMPKDWKKLISLYNSNERVSLDEFIKSIYVPGGKYYSRKNFTRKKAGEKFVYSNIGAGIASRIVEHASGMSFEEFTNKHIFAPIGMNSTSWKLDNIDMCRKSVPYLSYEIPLPHYSLVSFADGGLITSVHDLGLYILEMMNCYYGKGTVLSQEQAREMMNPYLVKSETPYGIFWETSPSGKSIGHNGGDPGTLTNMYFIPETGVAKIMFMNIVPYTKEVAEEMGEIWNSMKRYQERI